MQIAISFVYLCICFVQFVFFTRATCCKQPWMKMMIFVPIFFFLSLSLFNVYFYFPSFFLFSASVCLLLHMISGIIQIMVSLHQVRCFGKITIDGICKLAHLTSKPNSRQLHTFFHKLASTHSLHDSKWSSRNCGPECAVFGQSRSVSTETKPWQHQRISLLHRLV